jgi:hypothetical protein
MLTRSTGPVRLALSMVLALASGCSDARAPLPFKPVIETRLLMEAMVDPQADLIWQSVKTVVSEAGAQEFRPKTDAEWAQVLHAAASVTEAGNLLMMAPRARDSENWMRASQALIDSGSYALRAARAKNPDMLFEAGAVLYEACNACHRQYHWPPLRTRQRCRHGRSGGRGRDPDSSCL